MTLTAAEREEAIARLRPFVERARGFSGWYWEEDLRSRLIGESRPWDYMRRARELLSAAHRVLDMGTGGGERFAEICQGYEGNAVATEEWHVNAPVAARRLTPLGVAVVRARSLDLPFRDGAFDLVLNRHEELEPAEVVRVLSPGGRLLTQQVHGRHWQEINRFFPRRPDFGDHFRLYQEGLRAHGMEVLDAREHDAPAAYPGLGAFVNNLCVAPWEVPGFDPLGGDLEALLALERAHFRPDGLVLTDSSYVIEALKPV
jgi:SAM-dependent methyltransferase